LVSWKSIRPPHLFIAVNLFTDQYDGIIKKY
jgi:hypothetical protein